MPLGSDAKAEQGAENAEIRCRFPPKSPAAFDRNQMPVCSDFCTAYLMGRDKRGVSAKFLQRELGVAYQTAWTMAHKLRHLPQRPQFS